MEAAMPLTDAKARNARPKSKQFKIFDTDGLSLLVSPAGGKWWRFKYRLGGKEKLISLGTYPEVKLAQARVRRDEARKQVADNIDPSQARKALKASKVQNESTFEVVAREWHSKFTPTWTSGHAITIKSRLELNVFPWIGGRPIIEIKAPELLMVLRRIESRGALAPVKPKHLSAMTDPDEVARLILCLWRVNRLKSSESFTP